MRNYLVVLLLLTAFPSLATENPPEQKKPAEVKPVAFTDAERAEALEAIRTIAKNFQIDPATAKPAETTSQKNMADVADKALDISTKYIGQIASVLEKAAPHVWKVMVVQQYAKAIRDLIEPWGVFLILLILTFISRHMWKLKEDQKDDDFFDAGRDSGLTPREARGLFTFVLPSVAMLVTAIIGICSLADSVMYLINPEYYAVKDLLQILFNRGGI